MPPDLDKSQSESPLRVWMYGAGEPPFSPRSPVAPAYTFGSAVFGQMLSRDCALGLRSGLLESWDSAGSGRKYTLVLRPDIFFHNGRAVTAEDVRFGIERHRTARRSVYAAFFPNLESLDVIDERTIVAKVGRPSPPFPYSLAYGQFAPVPAEELQADGFTWRNLPVGAGPFRVLSWEPAKSLTRLQHVSSGREIELFTSGAADEADVVFGQVEAPSTRHRRFLGDIPERTWSIYFHESHPLALDPAFRAAIAGAVYRPRLTAGLDHSTANSQMLPRNSWGRLVEEEIPKLTRWENTTLEIPVLGPPLARTAEQALREQLAAVGLSVRFCRPSQEELAHLTAPFAIIGVGWSGVDPLVEFGTFAATSAMAPYRPKPTAEFEQLHTNAMEATALDARVASVRALSGWVEKTRAVIPLWESKPCVWVSERVQHLGHQDIGVQLFLDRLLAAKLTKHYQAAPVRAQPDVQQVAHDIHSPLTALSLLADQMQGIAPAEQSLLRVAIARIESIARSLSGDVKTEERKPFCALRAIEDLLAEKRVEHSSHRICDFQVAGTSANVEVPRPEFYRVLSNLLNNAAEAIEDTGSVRVSVVTEKEMVRVTIHDTGRGIPEEVLPKLFVRGHTFGKQTGKGLGLAHAHECLTRWGGSIGIESRPSVGTTVSLQIPLTRT